MARKVSIKREYRNVSIFRKTVVEKIEINSQLRSKPEQRVLEIPIFRYRCRRSTNTEIIYTIVSRSIVCVNYFQRGFINEQNNQ